MLLPAFPAQLIKANPAVLPRGLAHDSAAAAALLLHALIPVM